MPVTVIVEVHAGNRVTFQKTSPEGDVAYDNLTISEEDVEYGVDTFLRGLVNNERSADRVTDRREHVDRMEEEASLDREGVGPDRVAANDLPKSEATVASADRNEARSEERDEEPQAAQVQSNRKRATKAAQRDAQKRFEANADVREDRAEAQADQQNQVKEDVKALDADDPNVKRAEADKKKS